MNSINAVASCSEQAQERAKKIAWLERQIRANEAFLTIPPNNDHAKRFAQQALIVSLKQQLRKLELEHA